MALAIENLQWVEKEVNRLKGKKTMEQLLTLCRTIIDYTTTHTIKVGKKAAMPKKVKDSKKAA